MEAKFSKFDTGFKIAEVVAPVGGDDRIKYGMFSTAFKSKNLLAYLIPEELLQFTRDLAEMQGYALMEKEPEWWVPLADGHYVRDRLSDKAIAWYPDSTEAKRKVIDLDDSKYVCDHMAYLDNWSRITPEDFAPFRKLYYQNTPNP